MRRDGFCRRSNAELSRLLALPVVGSLRAGGAARGVGVTLRDYIYFDWRCISGERTSAAISRSLSLCSSGTRPRIVARANSELSAKEESNMTQYNQMQCNTAFTQESHNEHSVDEHHRTVLISILNILC